MTPRLILGLVVTALPIAAVSSDSAETERLASVTEQQARCSVVAVGNFASDKQTEEVVASLYRAMLKNVREMIEAERKRGSEKTKIFLEILGPDVFAGYILRSFADGDEEFKRARASLREDRGLDWKSANKALWAKHGCDAIVEASRQTNR